MKSLSSIQLSLVVFALVHQGCASTSTSAVKPDPKAEVAKVELKEKPIFQKGVQWETVEDRHASKCLVPTTKVEWKILVERAANCVSEKSWTNVEKLATTLLEQETDSAWGPYYMSLVAESRSQWARSFWMIETAIKRSPKTGAFVFQKARLAWKTEAYRDALTLARQSIELDPNLTSASEFVAQILYRDHDFAGALKELTRATAHGLRSASAWAMLGECHVQTGNNLAAIDAFEKAASAEPKRVDHRLRQAFIFDELLQNKSEALSRYLQVQELIKKGGYSGKLSFNLSEKIDGLKKLTAQTSAAVSREPGAATTGGKK